MEEIYENGCAISLGCFSVFIVVAIIVGIFGFKFYMHLAKNSAQYTTACSKLMPIIAECNPEELKKYAVNQNDDYVKFCEFLKKDSDKVEKIGDLTLVNYHESKGIDFNDGKISTKVGAYTVSIKYTSEEKKLNIIFEDKGDGPKVYSIFVNMN